MDWEGDKQPTKVQCEQGTVKVMLAVWFDKDGVIFSHFVPNGVGSDRIWCQNMLR